MTRVVRNKTTGMFVYIDPVLVESFEYEDVKQATIFNEEVDEMTDDDVIEYVASGYGDVAFDLEIVPIKISVEIC